MICGDAHRNIQKCSDTDMTRNIFCIGSNALKRIVGGQEEAVESEIGEGQCTFAIRMKIEYVILYPSPAMRSINDKPK